MPFVWVNEPQTPPQVEPLFYGPNTVSTQVGLVANSVQVHPPPPCTIKYVTPNTKYVIVCQYNSLNVDQFNITQLNGNNVFANNASLNNASINTSAIDTAHIANLNVQYLLSNTYPTANLHLATKEYVDQLIANSSPIGGNLQLLILQAGDLLAGVADNTANRVAIGSNTTDLLTVTPSVNTMVQWKSSIFPQGSSFRNLHLGTSRNYPLCNSVVTLYRAAEIVMDDGSITNNWSIMSADINTTGAGGLDVGSPESNTWYELYAIRNPVTDDRALMFHKSLDSRPHVSSNTSVPGQFGQVYQFLNTEYYLGPSGNVTPLIGQQFTSPVDGKIRSADILIRRRGVPDGFCWLTLHEQEANGFPNTITLCTSDIRHAIEIANVSTSGVRTRFIFRDGVNLVSNGRYVLVINNDYAQGSFANDNYMMLPGSILSTGFPQGGNCVVYRASTGDWALGTQTTPSGANSLYIRVFIEGNNTPVTMPTGYTQKCLVSYAATDIFGSLKEYSQRDRKITAPFHIQWRFFDLVTSSASYFPFGMIPVNTSQISHAIDIIYGVPPIPCTVMFNAQENTGGTQASPFIIGPPTSFEASMGGNFSFMESDGTVRANGGGGGTFLTAIGPIFVEEQCANIYIHSTSMSFYVSTVEF